MVFQMMNRHMNSQSPIIQSFLFPYIVFLFMEICILEQKSSLRVMSRYCILIQFSVYSENNFFQSYSEVAMRKTVAILLVLLLSIAGVYAGGSSESADSDVYKIGFIGAKIGRTPVNGFVAWLNLLCCLAQQPFTGEVPYISL